jgi:hypothetical protein
VFTAPVGGGENCTSGGEVRGGWRKLRNKELDDIYVGEDDELIEMRLMGM